MEHPTTDRDLTSGVLISDAMERGDVESLSALVAS